MLRAVAACRALPEAEARLACFDRAAAALEQAVASGEVAVVDREQQRKVRRQAFGLNLPEPRPVRSRRAQGGDRAADRHPGLRQFRAGRAAAVRDHGQRRLAHERRPGGCPHAGQGRGADHPQGRAGSFFCSVGTAQGRCERTR